MIQAFIELTQIYKVFDGAARLLEEQIGVPSCISHCGKCCHQTVMCMAIEAANMASSLSIPQVKAALDIAEGWLTEPVPGLKTYKGVPRGLLLRELFEEWQTVSKGQCPFLTEASLCRIYQWRPLTCRAFGVFRDGMPICPRPAGNGETDLKRAIVNSEGVSQVVKNFRLRCQKRNPAFVISGFVPTMILRAARPDRLKELIAGNKIPSAKLVGVDVNIDLLWQPQLDALRAGTGPMQVVQQSM